MAEEKSQKIKLLKIMEILRQETDKEHPMTKVELCYSDAQGEHVYGIFQSGEDGSLLLVKMQRSNGIT